MPAPNAPTISVLMMTYNHAPYVERAMRSVFAQEIDGAISLVVADDASPDGTAEIARRVAADAPHSVELVLRAANIGGHANFADAWSRCTGDFVALLEGDDFWTRPDKLAAQVRRLQERPKVTMSFHRVSSIGPDERARPESWPPQGMTRFDLDSLIQGNFAQTCSVVYRGGTVPTFPDWVFALPMGDWPLHLLHALRGDVDFLDIEAATYRFHAGGAWSGKLRSHQLRTSAEVLSLTARHSGAPLSAALKMRKRALQFRVSAARQARRERRT